MSTSPVATTVTDDGGVGVVWVVELVEVALVVADSLGVGYVDSYAELLRWRPDGTVVCAENSRHRELVELAAAGGSHVLCEKPIATTLADARAMINCCARHGVNLMVAYPVRFSPAFSGLLQTLRSGALGHPMAVTGTNNGRLPTDQRAWFTDPTLAGGGSLTDHTVHVADLLRWMLNVAAKSVYAEVGTFFGAEGIDDGAILTLELEGGTFADGTFATIDPSWSRGDGYPTWGDVTLRITGTTGVLDVDPFARYLTTFHHGSGDTSWAYTGEDMNALMLDDFLRGVAENDPAGASGEDGLRALEIVLAAYRSGEDHEPRSMRRT